MKQIKCEFLVMKCHLEQELKEKMSLNTFLSHFYCYCEFFHLGFPEMFVQTSLRIGQFFLMLLLKSDSTEKKSL